MNAILRKLKAIWLFFIGFIGVILTVSYIPRRRSLDSNVRHYKSNNNNSSNNNNIDNQSFGMSPEMFANITVPPKQFNIYKHDFPCISKTSTLKDNDSSGGGGLHYVKVYKTASSTISHVTKKIAMKHGSDCLYHNSHAGAYTFENLQNRMVNNQNGTFLFTFVRDPTERAISDFFWRSITQEGSDVNISTFKKSCCRKSQALNGQSGFQLAYISVDERLPEYTFWNRTVDANKVQHPALLLERVTNVFDSYDFIGVTERLDESLVVLSFLLDLSLSEISYVSYKHANDGQYVGITHHNQVRCYKVRKSELSMDIKNYIESSQWKARTAGDLLLHKTAMRTLDNTINEVIGRKAFEKRLSMFQLMQNKMKLCESLCLACSDTGKYKGREHCAKCVQKVQETF